MIKNMLLVIVQILYVLFQWGIALLINTVALITLIILITTETVPHDWSPISYVGLGVAAIMIDRVLAPKINRGLDRLVYRFF